MYALASGASGLVGLLARRVLSFLRCLLWVWSDRQAARAWSHIFVDVVHGIAVFPYMHFAGWGLNMRKEEIGMKAEKVVSGEFECGMLRAVLLSPPMDVIFLLLPRHALFFIMGMGTLQVAE